MLMAANTHPNMPAAAIAAPVVACWMDLGNTRRFGNDFALAARCGR